jgi:hypothetical protein
MNVLLSHMIVKNPPPTARASFRSLWICDRRNILGPLVRIDEFSDPAR